MTVSYLVDLHRKIGRLGAAQYAVMSRGQAATSLAFSLANRS